MEAIKAKMFLEDFVVGHKFVLGEYQFDEAEIVEFARKFDPQPFHIDRVAGAESVFGSVIASGWHTCSVVMRLHCDGFLLQTAGLGSPGINDLRWKRPVRPGDKIQAFTEVVKVKRSSSKPDRGMVTFSSTARNQDDQEVLSLDFLILVMGDGRPSQ